MGKCDKRYKANQMTLIYLLITTKKWNVNTIINKNKFLFLFENPRHAMFWHVHTN
jgi:hypothetical protein